MMTHTVRVYVSDETSDSGTALLEEHDFTDLDEARQCVRDLGLAGAGLVTLDASPKFAIKVDKASEHHWMWTYSGITADEAYEIAETLSAGSGELWTVEPIAG
jgi:hypothetical protein